jgi:hypothetical protein
MQQFFFRLQNYYFRLDARWRELRKAHLVSQQDAKRHVTARQLNLDWCRRQIEQGKGLYWPEWTAFLAAEIAADPGLHQALIHQLEREKYQVKEWQGMLIVLRILSRHYRASSPV